MTQDLVVGPSGGPDPGAFAREPEPRPGRVLVTGGAGFIGSHVVEALLGRGHAVAVLDDFNDYYDPARKRANLEEARRVGPVALFEGDLIQGEWVEAVLAEFRPATILHLAARAGVRPSIAEPVLYARVNTDGTTLLLEAARRAGIGKVVVGSTSSVYGVGDEVPFRESAALLRPISPYAASKIGAEAMAHVFHHLYGMETPVLRFFTVYGPRQRPDMAIHRFTRLIDEGAEVPMFGDGRTRRDYTHVSDIVAGVVAAIERPIGHVVLNLGESRTVELRYLIELIERALGKRARIRQLPEQPGDVPITYADVAEAGRLLGYRPKVSIEEGIPRFVEWYRAQQTARG